MEQEEMASMMMLEQNRLQAEKVKEQQKYEQVIDKIWTERVIDHVVYGA